MKQSHELNKQGKVHISAKSQRPQRPTRKPARRALRKAGDEVIHPDGSCTKRIEMDPELAARVVPKLLAAGVDFSAYARRLIAADLNSLKPASLLKDEKFVVSDGGWSLKVQITDEFSWESDGDMEEDEIRELAGAAKKLGITITMLIGRAMARVYGAAACGQNNATRSQEHAR